MAANINKPILAEKKLADVDPRKKFITRLGTEIKNLKELYEELMVMKGADFSHHVTAQKNDFAKWVKNVIKDSPLAESMLKTKDKNVTIALLKKRISQFNTEVEKRQKLLAAAPKPGIMPPKPEIRPVTFPSKTLAGKPIHEPQHPMMHLKHGLFVMSIGSVIGLLFGIFIGYLFFSFV